MWRLGPYARSCGLAWIRLCGQSNGPSLGPATGWSNIGKCRLEMVSGLPRILSTSHWSRALLYQVPLNALSLCFIWWKIKLPPTPEQTKVEAGKEQSTVAKLRRIDFLGALSLGIANCSLLLFLDEIQKNLDFLTKPEALVPLSFWAAFIIAFVIVESFWSREPIFPLRLLLQRNVFSSYSIQFLQTAAQMGVMICSAWI